MAELYVCPEADEELDALYETDEDAAALIEVLLEQLWEDERMLEMLCRPVDHFMHKPHYEVKRFVLMHKAGKNIYSVKLWSEEGSLYPYRVLIGFNAQEDSFHVLAIAPRKIAYEHTDPLFKSILDRYDAAGIPTYR